jgi:hypothetical protein
MYGPNMDYCQFENTVAAMKQCIETLRNGGVELAEENATSERERVSISEFLALCADVAEEYEEEIES